MSNEQNYYENDNLWALANFDASNQERFGTIAAKIPSDVQTLLDVGCGNGLFLKSISGVNNRTFERLCGSDRSSAALALVQGEKVQADIELLPFSNNEFDAVSCLEVLEHLPQSSYISAINEISRIADKYIILSVPFEENLPLCLVKCQMCYCHFNPYYHLRSFNHKIIHSLFEEKGFRCQEVFYMGHQRLVPAKLEVILRLLGVLKRKLLRQAAPQMPPLVVCPACGYSQGYIGNGAAHAKVTAPNSVGMMIRPLVSVKHGWRWIGAIYERL